MKLMAGHVRTKIRLLDKLMIAKGNKDREPFGNRADCREFVVLCDDAIDDRIHVALSFLEMPRARKLGSSTGGVPR